MSDTDRNPPPLSPEWIQAHNRKVRAWRGKYGPLVAAITREQAQAIVDLGLRQRLSMNRIAHAMQGRLAFEVPLDQDVAIGTDLYVRALEMLDLYDGDFRPRPAVHEMATLGKARLLHHAASNEFEVVLGDRSERFRAAHPPRFGVDVTDMARAIEAAARLSHAEAGPVRGSPSP